MRLATIALLTIVVGGFILSLVASEPSDDPLARILVLACLTLAVPRRSMWIALATWAVFWAWYAAREFELRGEDRLKWGEHAYLFAFVALVFGLASYLGFRRSYPRRPLS